MKLETIGTVLLVFGLAACSSPMVHTQYDHSLRFDSLKRYAWEPVAGSVGSDFLKDADLDTRVRSAIDTALQEKGFQLVSGANADLMISYEVSAEEKVDATHLENYERAKFMGLTYTLGTLHLTMSRPPSPAPVWQGTVQANIDSSKPLAERDAKLQQAVHTLLSKFPPISSK